MQYEAILLELMSRIKVLESDISTMKASISNLESAVLSEQTGSSDPVQSAPSPARGQNPTSYTKTTDQMIDACYLRGKEAYETPGVNIWSLADAVTNETGMNRNSAFMYIHAVKSMLEGVVFKRAVNTRALKRYFSAIHRDYGEDGLRRAVASVRKNISYRESFHLPSDSICAVCDEYERKLG